MAQYKIKQLHVEATDVILQRLASQMPAAATTGADALRTEAARRGSLLGSQAAAAAARLEANAKAHAQRGHATHDALEHGGQAPGAAAAAASDAEPPGGAACVAAADGQLGAGTVERVDPPKDHGHDQLAHLQGSSAGMDAGMGTAMGAGISIAQPKVEPLLPPPLAPHLQVGAGHVRIQRAFFKGVDLAWPGLAAFPYPFPP